MKILIVSKCPTHPTNAGNCWWILSQAQMFEQMGHEVHFLYVYELPMRKDKKPCVKSLELTHKYWGDRFHCFQVSRMSKLRMNLFKVYRHRFCHSHYKVDDLYPYGIEKMVNMLNMQLHFDICVINYYYMSRLFEYISIPKCAIATHDCIAYKDIKIGEPTMCITAHTEAVAMQRCPHIFALQGVEADYFQMLSPRSTVYNLYGNFCYCQQPIAGNHNMVFLSGNNCFNQNGIQWFLAEVFPLIRRRFPDARLLVGGSICKAMPQLYDIDGVEVQGYVDNVADFYAQADVAINPIYQGTGLKIKTFEAISYDKVTLVHPHSVEGIYDKQCAPLFASADGTAWVSQLELIWGDTKYITKAKLHNATYMQNMKVYVESEYKRFINEKNN